MVAWARLVLELFLERTVPRLVLLVDGPAMLPMLVELMEVASRQFVSLACKSSPSLDIFSNTLASASRL